MQINNTNSPNFGMALKIKANKETLSKLSMRELETIEKCGNKIKDTKTYHLVLDENAIPSIESPYANRYSEFFIAEEPHDQFLSVKTLWTGTEINNKKYGDKYTAVVNLTSRKAANYAYEKMKKAPTTIEKATEFVKILEEAHQVRLAKELEEQRLYNEKCAKADDLLKSFGDN